MKAILNRLLDNASEYFAHRKGLLPFVGITLVVVNFLLHVFVPGSWLSSTELFLHIGVLLAVIGFMLAWAL